MSKRLLILAALTLALAVVGLAPSAGVGSPIGVQAAKAQVPTDPADVDTPTPPEWSLR